MGLKRTWWKRSLLKCRTWCFFTHLCVRASARHMTIGFVIGLKFFFFPKQSEDLTVTPNRSRCVCIHNTGKNISSLRVSESWFTVNQIAATSTTVFVYYFSCFVLSHVAFFFFAYNSCLVAILGGHSLPERMPERSQRPCEIENGAGGGKRGVTFTSEYFLALCGMTEGLLFSSLLWFPPCFT